jgi:hypothetical protein
MNWLEVKNKILDELNNEERNLSDSSIRTNALISLEKLLKEIIIENPELLLKIGKENLLNSLTKIKKLNGAEKSIVNHVFNVLNEEPIPLKKKNKAK